MQFPNYLDKITNDGHKVVEEVIHTTITSVLSPFLQFFSHVVRSDMTLTHGHICHTIWTLSPTHGNDL